MENRVELSFEKFVAQFKLKQSASLATFFYQAEMHLIKQLKDYLDVEQTSETSFFALIEMAKKTNNNDTDSRFWEALLAFNQVNFHPSSSNAQSWLRYVNNIEALQGYNGSKLFEATKIKLKRQHRLYFAYMLTWEHLRFIAGNDDDYSPSNEILNCYSPMQGDVEHQHTADCCNISSCAN